MARAIALPHSHAKQIATVTEHASIRRRTIEVILAASLAAIGLVRMASPGKIILQNTHATFTRKRFPRDQKRARKGVWTDRNDSCPIDTVVSLMF
jgi:hypothetical protein